MSIRSACSATTCRFHHDRARERTGLRRFHDFLSQEPLLVVIGGAGLVLATRWRPEYRWVLWLQVIALLMVYLPRNDMRYFALLTPPLALSAGLFSREAWETFSPLWPVKGGAGTGRVGVCPRRWA
jgi:hypothetical protein